MNDKTESQAGNSAVEGKELQNCKHALVSQEMCSNCEENQYLMDFIW